jgi:RHS Repeat
VLDGRNNVVALTDTTGNVVDRYAYDIWGAPTTVTETVPQRLRYAVLALLVLAAGSTFVAAALIGIGTQEGYVGARYAAASRGRPFAGCM